MNADSGRFHGIAGSYTKVCGRVGRRRIKFKKAPSEMMGPFVFLPQKEILVFIQSGLIT